ncbi:MAG: IclR family transcriptional regulator [Pseudorhodobacter sp.]
MTGPEDRYRAPALSKGLDILELLASDPAGCTQAEIAKTLGRTAPEIFRMLMVLRDRGFVEQRDDERYVLTMRLFELAHRHPPIRRLTVAAGEPMQDLADRINQSVHLAILDGGSVVVMAQVDGPDNHLNSVRLGARFPLVETASGRVLAAWLAPDRLAALSSHLPPGAAPGFLADLAQVRQAGGWEADSFSIRGVRNISAPIRDITGRVVAALTIPYLHRLTGGPHPPPGAAQAALRDTALLISRRLGAGAQG